MTIPSFIFGGDTGLDYEDIKRRRQALEASMAQNSAETPQTFAKGLSALGTALVNRIEGKRLDRAQAQGRQRYNSTLRGLLGGTLNARPTPFAARNAGGDKYAAFNASLAGTESGGRHNARNAQGFTGKYQFGRERLNDFNRAAGTQYTTDDLLKSPQLQEKAQNWHVGDIDSFIDKNGLSGYVGQNIGGVTLTQNGMRAIAHLGGKGGLKKFLETRGRYNPADSNGTSLMDYAQTHAGNRGRQMAQMQPTNNPQLLQLFEMANNPYATQGQKAFLNLMIQKQMQKLGPPPERKILKGADGYQYYQDDGSRVLPNVQQTQEPGYQMLSPDQAQQMGLPEGAYQQGPKGRISQIGGAGTDVTVNNGADETAFAKTTGNELAKSTNDLAVAGDAARQNLNRINRLESLLKRSPTGLWGEITKFAGDLGIPIADNTDNLQAAQALISSMVPEQRPAGSGPMSDADLELFKQSLPRIINTEGGNAKIIETIRGITQYDIQRGQIARQLQLGEITPQQAFEMYGSLKNPLSWLNRDIGDGWEDLGNGVRIRQVN